MQTNKMSYNFTHEAFFSSKPITSSATLIQALPMPYADDCNSMAPDRLMLLLFIFHAAGRLIWSCHHPLFQYVFLSIALRILLTVLSLTFTNEWNCIQFNQRCGHYSQMGRKAGK